MADNAPVKTPGRTQVFWPQWMSAKQFELGPGSMNVEEFIARWAPSQASERANKDSYLKELCRVLGVPEPDVKTGDPERDVYVFEADARILSEEDRPRFGLMDLYKKDCFVLEAKQGSDKGSKKVGTAKRDTPGWAVAMGEAFGKSLQYARTLETPPPFVIVADLGYCFDLYACFDGSGAYRAFPNGQRN
ncbi:MAG TPA: type IIL restriction-modification enzyme MmeI, partial [Polyangiales bacterium]|nr:type IIL restriction-modification enzyme MmeI [Polyangiales bacterium]